MSSRSQWAALASGVGSAGPPPGASEQGGQHRNSAGELPSRVGSARPPPPKKCQKIRMSERMSENMPDRMSKDMRERTPEEMSEDMSDRISERMPKEMPEDMSEDMSEDKPQRMSKDMSERSVRRYVRRYARKNARFVMSFFEVSDERWSIFGYGNVKLKGSFRVAVTGVRMPRLNFFVAGAVLLKHSLKNCVCNSEVKRLVHMSFLKVVAQKRRF